MRKNILPVFGETNVIQGNIVFIFPEQGGKLGEDFRIPFSLIRVQCFQRKDSTPELPSLLRGGGDICRDCGKDPSR